MVEPRELVLFTGGAVWLGVVWRGLNITYDAVSAVCIFPLCHLVVGFEMRVFGRRSGGQFAQTSLEFVIQATGSP